MQARSVLQIPLASNGFRSRRESGPRAWGGRPVADDDSLAAVPGAENPTGISRRSGPASPLSIPPLPSEASGEQSNLPTPSFRANESPPANLPASRIPVQAGVYIAVAATALGRLLPPPLRDSDGRRRARTTPGLSSRRHRCLAMSIPAARPSPPPGPAPCLRHGARRRRGCCRGQPAGTRVAAAT